MHLGSQTSLELLAVFADRIFALQVLASRNPSYCIDNLILVRLDSSAKTLRLRLGAFSFISDLGL